MRNCRSCKGKTEEVLKKAELIFVLCRECGLLQLKQESSKEFDIDAVLQNVALHITEDSTLEGLYLPAIIEKRRIDLFTIDTPVYFTLLSLQRALLRNGLEMIDADVQDVTFRVAFKKLSRLKEMRMKEKQKKFQNKNTYLLFSLAIRNRK